MSPVADWYFTRCVNLPGLDPRVLIGSLQRLQLAALSLRRTVEVLEQIAGLDPRALAYAMPTLIEFTGATAPVEARLVASRIVSEIMTPRFSGTTAVALADLLENLVRDPEDGSEGIDLLVPLETIAADCLTREVLDERTPYSGVVAQLPQLLALSAVMQLANDQLYAAPLSEALVSCIGDEPEGALATFVLRCAAGEIGRLPLVLAIQVIEKCVDPARALDLLRAGLSADEPRLSVWEPDVVAVAAAAAICAPGAASFAALVDQPGLADFVGRADSLDERREPASPTLLRRLGIVSEDDATALRATVWQATQLRVALERGQLAKDEVAMIFAPRGNVPSLWKVAARSSRWERDAVYLARASDVEVSFRASKPEEGVSAAQLAHLLASPWPLGTVTAHGINHRSLDSLQGAIKVCLAAATSASGLSRAGVQSEVDAEKWAATRSFFRYVEVVLNQRVTRRGARASAWLVLLQSTLDSLSEISGGHVGTVSPNDLIEWGNTATDAIDAKLAGSGDRALASRMIDDVYGRPLAWALVAAPLLDDPDGPGRWVEELLGLVEADLDDADFGVAASMLNDIMRRLSLPCVRDRHRSTAPWIELARKPAVGPDEILLSETSDQDSWAHAPEAKLSHAARTALAIRRIECLDGAELELSEGAFVEFVSAMAAFLRQRRPDFYVLVRSVALLGHPFVRASEVRSEQVAALAIATDEPLLWRFALSSILSTSGEASGDDEVIWRILGSALRRLISQKSSTSTIDRLRAVWRSQLSEAIRAEPLGTRATTLDVLVAAAETDERDQSAVDTISLALTPGGIGRSTLVPRGADGAGATWLTRALVLDPSGDDHGALLDAVDPGGVSRYFPPSNRHRPLLASVIRVAEDKRSAEVHIGEAKLRRVQVRGTPPRPGDLVRYRSDERATERVTRFPASRVPGATSKILLKPNPRDSSGDGRILALQRQPGAAHESVDPRIWDADTARAYAGKLIGSGPIEALAVLDPDLGWRPYLRDGLALVVAMAIDMRPATLVYNEPHPHGWVVSSAPGKTYLLRRSDMAPAGADAIDQQLATADDPNGLLITFTLIDDFTIGLWEGEHSTRTHGDISCPFDRRNLAWRQVVDRYRNGVLLAPEDGAWTLPIDPPSKPFPDVLRLTVVSEQRQRRPSAPTPQLLTLDSFEQDAQRTGCLGAKIEPAFAMHGEPAVIMQQLIHATRPEAVVLGQVIGGVQSAGWVMCSTESGFAVALRPEDLTLAPCTGADLAALRIRGRTALLLPPRADSERDAGNWIAVPVEMVSDLEAYFGPDRSEVAGIVWARTKSAEAGSMVEVKLDVEGYPSVMFNFGSLTAQAGHVVRLRRNSEGSGAEVRLDRPFRVAHMVHPPLRLRGPVEGAVFVGRFAQRAGTEAADVVQAPDGSLHLVPERPDLPLYATYRQGTWASPSSMWMNGCRINRATTGERREWTLVSKPRSGGIAPNSDSLEIVGGFANRRRLTLGAGSLRDSRISAQPCAGGVTISRELIVANLEQRRESRSTRKNSVAPDSTDVDIAAELDRLWATGEPIDVEFEPRSGRRASVVELRQLGALQRETMLPVVDDLPVAVSGASYDTRGVARLTLIDAHKYGLSFRDVPDLDVDEYAAFLGASADTIIRPPRLVFAMTENGNSVLEFGYGLRVSADPGRLRFNGEPFDRSIGVLFHGDEIGEVAFIREADQLVLDIRGASIKSSAATKIYQQARLYGSAQLRFLHLLRVEVRQGELLVGQIEGFSPAATLSARTVFRGPAISRARLRPNDAQLMLNGLAADESKLIYGELDTDLFAASAGLTLEFSHRTLTSSGLADIGHQVVTFLTCGVIRNLRREVGLEVRAASSDAGDLDDGLMVIRRNFSVDVNQLSRLARLEGNDALEGALVVARLSLERAAKTRVQIRLADDGVPDRSTSSLRDLTLQHGGLHLLVAKIDSRRGRPSVRLEFRFGIYFSLEPDEIEDSPTDLVKGDVVRVTWSASSRRFSMIRCAPSDRRFFGSRPRPLVALPTNPLFDRATFEGANNLNEWRRAQFVAGGLPSEFATPATYDLLTAAWSAPRPADLSAMMRRPHPKIGLFGIAGGRLQMSPAMRNVGAGRVQFSSGRAEVLIDGTSRLTDPSLLTFLDATATEVERHARDVRWGYHDERTVQWVENGASDDPVLPIHSHTDGALVFFEQGDRLRYSGELDHWAYPSRFLTQGVHSSIVSRRGKTSHDIVRAAIAGLSFDADGLPDGLYLEVAPGLICLVLNTLLEVELADGRASPLDSIAMSAFGVGDAVDIRVASDSARSVDGVRLVRWAPSARGVAGYSANTSGGRLIAPVIDFDAVNGGLRLGAGALRIVVPTWATPPSPVVTLGRDNAVDKFATSPRSGDTVLLTVEDHELVVAGLPGVKPYTLRDSWALDRWHDHLYDDRPLARASRVRRDVMAAGGALAVTVEGMSRDRTSLKFSFRGQFQHLLDGRSHIGHIVGADGRDLLIRTGAAVLRIGAERVIAGIPEHAVIAAAEMLRERRVIIWLDHDGGRLVGRGPSAEDTSQYFAEADVTGADGNRGSAESSVGGLIVREIATHALRWLDANELALTPLSSGERRLLWLGRVRPTFPAQAIVTPARTGAVSILALPDVQRERSRLGLGVPLGVTVRARVERSEEAALLVETRAGVILELQCAEPDRFGVGDQLGAEISSISNRGLEITAVPTGERRFHLALPRRLFDHRFAVDENASGDGSWRPFVHLMVGNPVADGGSIPTDGAELDAALAGSYLSRSPDHPSTRSAAFAAEWWRRIRPTDEIELLPTLISAYLLISAASSSLGDLVADSGTDDDYVLRDSQQVWNRLATELLASLGRRSLRSLHVEALLSHWYRLRDRHRGIGWDQLELSARFLGGPVQSNWRELLEPLLVQLELGAGREGRLTAAALRVAGGDVDAATRILGDEDLLLPDVIVTARVSDPSLLGPDGKGGPRRPRVVADLQLARLANTIDRIRANGSDLILLADPLWYARGRSSVDSGS